MATNCSPLGFDPDERRIIRDKIKPLVRHRAIARHEAEDVEQHVFGYVWERLPHYDASRGSRRGYLVRLIDNALANYLRDAHAAKRYSPSRQSLSQRAPATGEPSMSLAEVISQREYDGRRGTHLTPEEAAEWALDMADVMSLLSEEFRDVFRCLLRGLTPGEIARELELSRSTVHRRIDKLRARLHQIDPDRF